jgi:RNA polymerase sigma-70 factor (ECF subfamily)
MEPSSAAEPHAASADARQVAALRAGDEAAFLALVSRHRAAMLRVAAAYVRSRAVAEEVVQETWIGVLQGLGRFEGRSSLKGWVFGILVNCAKTRAARERRAVPMSSLGEEDAPAVSPDRFRGDADPWPGHWAVPPEPWPDARVESSELVALVGEALEVLPEMQRTVMTLRDVEGWDGAEVCALLGISDVNQRVLLHRARSRVRGLVEERLGREAGA